MLRFSRLIITSMIVAWLLGLAPADGWIQPLEAGTHQTRQAEPPFWGTIFLDPDIITGADPTAFQNAAYAGRGLRTMFDRRVNDWITVNAYLFNATFADGLNAEIQVNPEFGSSSAALVEAQRYGEVIGRLPTVLRSDVQTVWIHQGTEPFGGGNNNILIHVGQAALYEADGILEETLVHEAAHTSLDAAHASAPAWLAAQAADGTFISTYARDYPSQEDIAESFLPYLAVRYRPDRISQQLADTIRQTIPNRIAYFDSQSFDVYPFLSPPNVSLTKSSSALTPQPGQPLNYILSITNNGWGPTTGGQLLDALPAGISAAGPVTLEPAGIGTAGSLPAVVTDLTLAPGQAVTITIPVAVNVGQPAGTLITNTAAFTSAEIAVPITASSVITLANAPLVARDDFATTPPATPVTIDVLSNDGDPNGGSVAITAWGPPPNGTVNLVDANLVYTPGLGFFGTDVFTYTISTGVESASAAVTVRVEGKDLRLFLPLIRR